MSWGWGVVLSMCKKQKLNTKSSSESEIVGVSDYLRNVIWGKCFWKLKATKQRRILSTRIIKPR